MCLAFLCQENTSNILLKKCFPHCKIWKIHNQWTVDQINQDFSNKKQINNWCYKNNMKTYCLKCRKDTENIDPKMIRANNNRSIMQSKCSVCGIKMSIFVKEQEEIGLLINLEFKTPLRKFPLLNLFF